ncbi:MAG: hypothetical protein JXA97_10650 [Anaerolineales bacterium]|nr:hypothetical protein [Anaerolineales bacterium]
MTNRNHRRTNIFLLLVFCLGMIPLPAQARWMEHPLEDSLLLMVNAQQRIVAAMPDPTTKPGLSSLAPLADGPVNEVDIVMNLYGSYLSALQRSGSASDENIDRLVDGLQEKMGDLQARSARLNARRQRRRRGLFGFLRRVGRSIGNILSRAGQLIGRAAEMLVEDIAPQVIKNMILTGQPLTADIFWHGVRQVVRSRLKTFASATLARKGVPPALLDAVGLPAPDDEMAAEPGGDDPGEDETQGGQSSTAVPAPTSSPSTDRPERYGRTTVAINGTASFGWANFWTDLPDNDVSDCQPTGDPQLDAYAYDQELIFNLTFDPDNDEITGNFRGSVQSDPYIDWRITTVDIQGRVAESWIEALDNHEGWEFGGTMVLALTFESQLQCHAIRLTDSGFRVWDHIYWTEQTDSIQLTQEFYGQTFQAGENGGTYDIDIGRDSEGDIEAYIRCYDCALPGDFPPP